MEAVSLCYVLLQLISIDWEIYSYYGGILAYFLIGNGPFLALAMAWQNPWVEIDPLQNNSLNIIDQSKNMATIMT